MRVFLVASGCHNAPSSGSGCKFAYPLRQFGLYPCNVVFGDRYALWVMVLFLEGECLLEFFQCRRVGSLLFVNDPQILDSNCQFNRIVVLLIDGGCLLEIADRHVKPPRIPQQLAQFAERGRFAVVIANAVVDLQALLKFAEGSLPMEVTGGAIAGGTGESVVDQALLVEVPPSNVTYPDLRFMVSADALFANASS